MFGLYDLLHLLSTYFISLMIRFASNLLSDSNRSLHFFRCSNFAQGS